MLKTFYFMIFIIPALCFSNSCVLIDTEEFRQHLISSQNENLKISLNNIEDEKLYFYHLGQSQAYNEILDNLYRFYK